MIDLVVKGEKNGKEVTSFNFPLTKTNVTNH